MVNYMKRIIVYLIILSVTGISSFYNFPCSVFSINHGVHFAVGKNLDWSVGDGYIIINKKNTLNFAMNGKTNDPFRWVSKLGSVTFNQFGKGMPLGGMNEKGLVVEELSYAPSDYPEDKDIPAVNEFQWIQYQLDNFCSVNEVITNIGKIRISKFFVGLHYFVCDRHGECAVIEFINGDIKIYTGADLPVKAVTNNNYPNLLKYLKFYKGFGGSLIATSGPESPERFVRIATELKDERSKAGDDPVSSAFGILKVASQYDTQWSIVYDLATLKIHFRIKNSKTVSSVNLRDMNFQDNMGSVFYNIKKNDEKLILVSAFSRLDSENNFKLIRMNLEKLLRYKELDQFKYAEILKIMNRFYSGSPIFR